MIDNFEQIKEMLEFKEGEFYFLQILKRPFNLKELEPYQATATHIEIHKNNPTLLYYGHSN